MVAFLKEEGFSTLELLFYMAMSSVVALSVFKTLKTTLSFTKDRLVAAELDNMLYRSKQLVVSAVEKSAKTAPIDNFIIHSPDELTHLIKNLASNSSAFSFLQLEPLANLYKSTENLEATLYCSSSSSLNTRASNLWLGISNSSVSFIKLKIKRGASSWCENTWRVVQQEKSDTLPFEAFNLCPKCEHRFTLLFKVKQAYTIYLDKNQTLRRKSWDSIENQPLIYGISEFSLNTLPKFNQAIFNATANYINEGRVVKSKSVSSTLSVPARKKKLFEYLNFVL